MLSAPASSSIASREWIGRFLGLTGYTASPPTPSRTFPSTLSFPAGLLGSTGSQNPVTVVFLRPLGGWENLHHDPGETHDLAVGVEAVVVAEGAAPGDVVEAVPESVGVLVVVGLPEALRRDVDGVVGGPEVPGEGDVVVALPKVGENILRLRVVGVGDGGDGLDPGCRVARDFQRGGFQP